MTASRKQYKIEMQQLWNANSNFTVYLIAGERIFAIFTVNVLHWFLTKRGRRRCSINFHLLTVRFDRRRVIAASLLTVAGDRASNTGIEFDVRLISPSIFASTPQKSQTKPLHNDTTGGGL